MRTPPRRELHLCRRAELPRGPGVCGWPGAGQPGCWPGRGGRGAGCWP